MDKEIKPKIAKMSLDMIRRRIYADAEWGPENREEIVDRLENIAYELGLTWDHVTGIDPRKGPERQYGTRNRRSMTYKLRKAANFSYP